MRCLSAYLDVNTGVSLLHNIALSYAFKAQQVERRWPSRWRSDAALQLRAADYLKV
nr:hypothetical protein [Deltaproteobacteria bacterium]